jgi:hypothetical protein
MRLLVSGSREFDDKAKMLSIIQDINPTLIIHGAAKGADTLAGEIGDELGIPVDPYPAKWSLYGKAAGPIRNQQMLDEGKPDLVIAFPTEGCRGTWDMVRRAIKADVKLITYFPEDSYAGKVCKAKAEDVEG